MVRAQARVCLEAHTGWRSRACAAARRVRRCACADAPPHRRAGKLLATAGRHDGTVCLWDWRAGQLLARQAVQGEAAAAVFTEDGLNLVAVGKGAYKVRPR